MLRTYDRIGSAGHALGSRTKIAQLNTLRNNVKHQGLHPNPTVVTQLVAETRQFADSLSEKYFGRDLSRIRLVDLIANDDTRSSMAQIGTMIDDGRFRDALEEMARVIYDVYESGHFEFVRSLLRHTSPAPLDPEEVEFPKTDRAERRLDLVELGINPEEYEKFHYVVPRVGVRGYGDEKQYVLSKSRHLWHVGNFTRETCDSAFDFLLRLILAQQRLQRSDSFARVNPLDQITFVRDSAIFEVRDQTKVLRSYQAGSEVYAIALPYVDGEWQNFGEQLVLTTIYDRGEQLFGCIRKGDIAVTPDVSFPELGREA